MHLCRNAYDGHGDCLDGQDESPCTWGFRTQHCADTGIFDACFPTADQTASYQANAQADEWALLSVTERMQRSVPHRARVQARYKELVCSDNHQDRSSNRQDQLNASASELLSVGDGQGYELQQWYRFGPVDR